MIKYLFIIILFLSLSQYSKADSDELKNPIYFLRTMPMSDCVHSKCTIPKYYRTFSLHVFQVRNDTYTPAKCDPNNPFDINKVKSIKKKLEEAWPDFRNWDSPQGFWGTQWEHSGTCTEPYLTTQLAYFQQALTARENVHPNKALIEASILPSNTTTYTYSQFDDAFTKHHGKKTTIKCMNSWNDVVILHEIGYCFDMDFNAVDCSETIRNEQKEWCDDGSKIFLLDWWKQ
ncbi:ribonuclease t2 [Anaeramoeba flamelloides]|uniref:Ribonuclease t2 n=1 Tax=Anaeramoeba flamelloides TaxID=1746091 RepID=A0AAV8AA42_9EUKA|nr:ribonuclease t2 [Anaeramoeba flamelloides]